MATPALRSFSMLVVVVGLGVSTSACSEASEGDSTEGGDGDGDGDGDGAGDGDGDGDGAGDGDGDGDGDGSGDGDGDGDGDGAGDGDGDGDGGPVEWTRVSEPDAMAVLDSVDLHIADDGTIYVSWVADGDGQVTRSTDGGATWSPPVDVDGDEVSPLAGSGRHPYLAVSDQTVFVVFNDQSAGGLWIYESSIAGALDFSAQTQLPVTDPADYPMGAVSPTGELWVAWQQYTDGVGFMAYGRESNGFASEVVGGGLPGLPCECCHPDFRFDEAGQAVLAFRNNVDDLRNMWVARALAGADSFTESAEASHTDWMSNICPMEGPRLGEEFDGSRQYLAWADSTSGEWRAYVGSSDDAGASWGDEVMLAPDINQAQGIPSVAASDSGTVYAVFEVGFGQSALVTSTDQGESFGPPDELLVDGQALGAPLVRGRDGVTAIVGTSPSGEVWFRRFE